MKKKMEACAILALAVACGGGSDTGRGEGIVRAVDPVANKVTLDHGTIPGMMDRLKAEKPEMLPGSRPVTGSASPSARMATSTR